MTIKWLSYSLWEKMGRLHTLIHYLIRPMHFWIPNSFACNLPSHIYLPQSSDSSYCRLVKAGRGSHELKEGGRFVKFTGRGMFLIHVGTHLSVTWNQIDKSFKGCMASPILTSLCFEVTFKNCQVLKEMRTNSYQTDELMSLVWLNDNQNIWRGFKHHQCPLDSMLASKNYFG